MNIKKIRFRLKEFYLKFFCSCLLNQIVLIPAQIISRYMYHNNFFLAASLFNMIIRKSRLLYNMLTKYRPRR